MISKITHGVEDLISDHKNDIVFVGTEQECNHWIDQQGSPMDYMTYEIVPLTKEQIKLYSELLNQQHENKNI